MPTENVSQTFEQTTQLLVRNLNLLEGSNSLVVNYPSDDVLLMLKERLVTSKVTGFTHDYAAHRYAVASLTSANDTALDLIYDTVYPVNLLCDTVIIYLPKSQPLTKMILQMTAEILPLGGRVLLVGHNNAGIRSSQALLQEIIGPTHKVDAARHCVLFQATLKTQARQFDLADWRINYPVVVDGQTLTVTSFPGVFSHGHLDMGTQLLLETLHDVWGERLLEFGCGAGMIGATIKTLYPTMHVDMIDTDALALLAARHTMVENGLSLEQIYPSDLFSNVQGTYDWIISNPPFHRGVQTDYQATKRFIMQSAAFLNPNGRLRVVANRFLKYQPLIEQHVGTCRIVAENNQYCVYEATRK